MFSFLNVLLLKIDFMPSMFDYRIFSNQCFVGNVQCLFDHLVSYHKVGRVWFKGCGSKFVGMAYASTILELQ